ncbi:MAG: hypothetical protein ABIQ31_08665 [Ferruginibacter sp.]
MVWQNRYFYGGTANEDMKSVIALLKAIDTGWKITMAGNYHPET